MNSGCPYYGYSGVAVGDMFISSDSEGVLQPYTVSVRWDTRVPVPVTTFAIIGSLATDPLRAFAYLPIADRVGYLQYSVF